MKTTMKTGIAAFLLLAAISCKKENMNSPSAAAKQPLNTARTESVLHHLGERYGGGIVFLVDTSGTHGLIASTEDLGAATWYDGVFIVTGATEFGLGTGPKNTRKIVQAQGYGNYAASMCVKYKGGGYEDWFLPSATELKYLYKNGAEVGNFKRAYWSSTEKTDHKAWAQNFATGDSGVVIKSTTLYVRAIRLF
ncbi:MAG: DUF1566 domain-containing protein [Parafilimonas sp.]